MLRRAGVVAMAALCSGCVPLPVHIYAPVAPTGEVVYSSCRFNGHIPTGQKVRSAGIAATLSLDQGDSGGWIRTQIDIPLGVTVVFDEDVIRIDQGDGRVLEAHIPGINRIAPPNAQSGLPDLLPTRTPLVGQRTVVGGVSVDKHYWFAAPFDAHQANDLRITLPSFTADGRQARFAELQFHRQIMVAIALINC